MSNIEWQERIVDGQFLVDSGLLYMINREILHPIGLALSVTTDGKLLIKAMLDKPEEMIFKKEMVIKGYAKFKQFMLSFGNQQIEKRQEKLGWGTQPQIYGEK